RGRSENDTPRGQSWKRAFPQQAHAGFSRCLARWRRVPERGAGGRCPPGAAELLPPLVLREPAGELLSPPSTRTGATAPREGRAEVGRSGCARRSATVRQSQPETLDSRTVAHDRGRSQQGETGMAFKRSWVRLPSAPLFPLHHSLGDTHAERPLNSTTAPRRRSRLD